MNLEYWLRLLIFRFRIGFLNSWIEADVDCGYELIVFVWQSVDRLLRTAWLLPTTEA